MAKFRFLEFDDLDTDENPEQGSPNAFAELLAEESKSAASQRTGYSVAEKISGVVLQVGRESLFVDLGSKLTATIPLSEWDAASETPPQVNDTVELYVKAASGSEVVLTRVLKTESNNTEELLRAKESLTPVEAKVEKVVNGGFQVKLGTTRAFVPISHMELYSAAGSASPLDKPEDYVGKTFPFHVLEVKEGGRNILLSRRTLLKEQQDEDSRKILNELTEGETRTAVITKLMPFGAFARLGPGVEGLIPMGELAWKRVVKASDAVAEGDTVQVKVLSVTHSPKLKISLSLKDAGTDPWLLTATRLKTGETVPGKVTRVSEFGAFVEIDEGIEGLVHVSELSWTKRIRHPGDVLKVGQAESFTVLNVNPSQRRLSLSFRGPMPEDMQSKAKEIADRKSGAMGTEDRELMESWTAYQQAQKEGAQTTGSGLAANPSGASTSAFASAFASAKNRKR